MKKIIILSLLVFVFSACSSQITAEPTPTKTLAPIPTDTPLPPTPTSEPTSTTLPTPTTQPTPTPDPMNFRDDFNGEIDGSWQWIREDKQAWSLSNNSGWLEIMASPGGVGNGTTSNLLLRPIPEGNFELETRLNFMPTGNYQIAGLLIYESPKNFVQFGRAFCNNTNCAGDGFYLDVVSDGNLINENFATKAGEIETIFLRLRREGNLFTGFVSENGQDWKQIGAHMSDAIQPIFVGLVAGQSIQTKPKPAQYDYFLVNRLP